MAMFTFSVIVVCLLSYVAGSIPSGFLVAKRLANVDLRTVGSGSTGATNVLRVCGKGPAFFVMAFDIVKGIIPVAGAIYLDKHLMASPMSQWHLLAPLSAICLLIGHSRSLFLQFKGGKSAATALGTLIALNTWTAAVVFSTWILLVATVRIVSVASLVAALLAPIAMYLFDGYASYIAYCLAGTLAIFYLHRANIVRLRQRTEPTVGKMQKCNTGG